MVHGDGVGASQPGQHLRFAMEAFDEGLAIGFAFSVGLAFDGGWGEEFERNFSSDGDFGCLVDTREPSAAQGGLDAVTTFENFAF